MIETRMSLLERVRDPADAEAVQTCPHCGAFIDVGDDAGPEGWDEFPEEELP